MDFVHLLLDAVEHEDFINNSSVRLGGPTGETLFARLKEASVESVNTVFSRHLVEMLRSLSKALRHREAALAFDITDEPYYGHVEGLWIHPQKPAKGSTGCFKFLAVSAVDRRNRLLLGCLPVAIGADIAALITRLLLQARRVIRPRLCLFDRGFDSYQLIERLQQLGVRYQILWQKKAWAKKQLKGMRRGEIREVNRTGIYSRNKTTHRIRLRFVLIKGYRRFARSKAYDWVFCTNTREHWAHGYVDKYRQRWGIETLFRVLDTVQIRTATKNPVIRYFLLAFCCFLYNLWKCAGLEESMVSLKNFTVAVIAGLPAPLRRQVCIPDS